MSKGSTRRPSAVDATTLADNWERTFGQDEDSASPLASEASQPLQHKVLH